MPATPLHQCIAYNIVQWLFAPVEKRSTVCGPHRPFKSPKNLLDNIESSGMSIFEMSSAKAFSSIGTYSTEVVMRCRGQNQKSSLANSLMMSLGLPRFTIPKRFCASTCKTTNLPSHRCTMDCRHR